MKPSFKKPGDFTTAEGHRHPLVLIKFIAIQANFYMFMKHISFEKLAIWIFSTFHNDMKPCDTKKN